MKNFSKKVDTQAKMCGRSRYGYCLQATRTAFEIENRKIKSAPWGIIDAMACNIAHPVKK